MDVVTIIFIAFALSMDAFAVSLCLGASAKSDKASTAFKAGIFFGGFQAAMPLAGWAVGFFLNEIIRQVDHWVAFVLLTVIGIRMIREAMKPRDCKTNYNAESITVMLSLALATSIDALAAGISFALLQIPVLIAISIIGVITFVLSYTGVHLGKRLSSTSGNKAEISGGVILICIGLKILIEHLYNNS